VSLRGNIADDAMQMDVNKTLYPFHTTKKITRVTVTITKNASLAAIARYISIMTVYIVGYLQIFNAGISFQVSIVITSVRRGGHCAMATPLDPKNKKM